MSTINTPLSYDELNSHLNNTTNKLQTLFLDVIKRTQNWKPTLLAGPDMMSLLEQRCVNFRYSTTEQYPTGVVFIVGCNIHVRLDFTIPTTSLIIDDGTPLIQ